MNVKLSYPNFTIIRVKSYDKSAYICVLRIFYEKVKGALGHNI